MTTTMVPDAINLSSQRRSQINEVPASLFDLVTKLAIALSPYKIEERGLPAAINLVSQRRSQIYEVLLRSSSSSAPQIQPPSARSELLRQQFACQLSPNEILQQRLQKLNGFQKLAKKHDAFLASRLGNGIAYLLLNISEPIVVPSPLVENPNPLYKLLTPAPFVLEAPVCQSVDRRLKTLWQEEPTIFISIKNMSQQLPITESHLEMKHDLLQAAQSTQHVVREQIIYGGTFHDSFARLREPIKPLDNRPFRLPMLVDLVADSQPSEKTLVGDDNIPAHKNFASDLNITNELRICGDKEQITLSIVSREDLISDLKKVAAGLQSETFLLSTEGTFQLKPNTTMETVMPASLEELARPFVDCGNGYLRLQNLAKWHRKEGIVERPLDRSMRYLINDFLANCRNVLLTETATEVSQLYQNSRSVMQLLTELDQMLAAEIDVIGGTAGIQLLRIMWSRVDACVNSDFSALLVYFLRKLVQTYYSQMEKWVFHGILQPPNLNELFIHYNTSQTEEYTKEFFDKAFQIRSDAVPGFLKHCDQEILQCGKYNRLLKAYREKHPVFQLKYPGIQVCLSEEEILKVRRNLDNHYTHIYDNFEPCSMKHVFDERADEKAKFKHYMRQRTQDHILSWEEQQKALIQEENEKKRLLFEELSAQREEEIERKIEERRMDIVRELEFQNEAKKLEELRLMREKESLMKEIEELQPQQQQISPDRTSSTLSFVSCCGELSEEPPQAANSTSLGVQLKRSLSDVLNSNDPVKEPVTTELGRNRENMMSSNNIFESQTWVQLKGTVPVTLAVSEAEQNRLRVLNCTESTATIDVNRNKVSDVQRNRDRMMQHDAFNAYNLNEDVHTQRVKSYLSSNTEFARNRRRVLEGEYNITVPKDLNLPLNCIKPQVEDKVPTPMSTTSDAEIQEENQDAANNNEVVQTLKEPTNEQETASEYELAIPKDMSEKGVQTSESIDLTPEIEKVEEDSKPWNEFFQLHKKTKHSPPLETYHSGAHNPYMIKRYLQLSVMIPMAAHFSLLRNEMLRVFLKDLRIYDHFRHLRNYFFLLNGEFGNLLTSGILGHIEEGMEPRSLCQKGVLDGILNNALGATSSAEAAAVTQNLTLQCTKIPDTFDLMSLDVASIFTLHYKVEWPLNLVISPETVCKYSKIFSYLLKLRHVGFVLERSYEYLQSVAKLLGTGLRVSPQYRHLQMVRHKLYHFVTTLQNHLASNALQASWKTFKEDLCSADSVEELYQKHAAYLKRIVFLTLLNRQSSKFQETIDGIFVIILRFCKVLHSQTFTLEGDHFVHPRYKRLIYEESEFEKFMKYIVYLGQKVAASGYQDQIWDLILIINFNNYYRVSEASA